jgi:DoxX-like family
VTSLLLPRTAIALVWAYQGFWCKLLGHAPHQQRIVGTVPFLTSSQARQALTALGFLECALAAWILSGIGMREAALTQTLLLVSMNTAGFLWARSLIPDPAGMLLQNFVFLLLAWVAAGQFGSYAGG